MKSFDIEITETLQRTVSVAADSREEAEQMVDDGWHKGHFETRDRTDDQHQR